MVTDYTDNIENWISYDIMFKDQKDVLIKS